MLVFPVFELTQISNDIDKVVGLLPVLYEGRHLPLDLCHGGSVRLPVTSSATVANRPNLRLNSESVTQIFFIAPLPQSLYDVKPKGAVGELSALLGN
jgi:hypothetical protein